MCWRVWPCLPAVICQPVYVSESVTTSTQMSHNSSTTYPTTSVNRFLPNKFNHSYTSKCCAGTVSQYCRQYHSIEAKPSVLQASRRVTFKFTHCNQKVSNVSLWLETIWQKWSNPNHQWESWFEAWLSFADAMIFCHEIQTRCVVNTVHSLYPVSVDKLYGKILTDQNDLKTSSSIQVYLRVLRIQNVLYEF